MTSNVPFVVKLNLGFKARLVNAFIVLNVFGPMWRYLLYVRIVKNIVL